MVLDANTGAGLGGGMGVGRGAEMEAGRGAGGHVIAPAPRAAPSSATAVQHADSVVGGLPVAADAADATRGFAPEVDGRLGKDANSDDGEGGWDYEHAASDDDVDLGKAEGADVGGFGDLEGKGVADSDEELSADIRAQLAREEREEQEDAERERGEAKTARSVGEDSDEREEAEGGPGWQRKGGGGGDRDGAGRKRGRDNGDGDDGEDAAVPRASRRPRAEADTENTVAPAPPGVSPADLEIEHIIERMIETLQRRGSLRPNDLLRALELRDAEGETTAREAFKQAIKEAVRVGRVAYTKEDGRAWVRLNDPS